MQWSLLEMGKLLFSSVRWRTKEKIKHNTRNQGKKYCIDNIVDMWFAKMQVSFFLSTWKHEVICMVCMKVTGLKHYHTASNAWLKNKDVTPFQKQNTGMGQQNT